MAIQGIKKQKEILEFCKAYSKQHGYMPSVREIGIGVGLRSSSSVSHHMQLLIFYGYLATENPGSPRAFRITGKELVEDGTEGI